MPDGDELGVTTTTVVDPATDGTAVPPAEPVNPSAPPPAQPQAVTPEPPPVRNFADFNPESDHRVQRIRQAALRVKDEASDANVAAFADSVVESMTDLAAENFDLRQNVDGATRAVKSLTGWAKHDADPANKNYPSAIARNDYRDLLSQVSTEYSGADPETIKAIASDRFRQTLPAKRAAQPPEPTPVPPEPTPIASTRQVGATRAVPVTARQAAPAPAQRMTVQEMLDTGRVPDAAAEEMKAFANR